LEGVSCLSSSDYKNIDRKNGLRYVEWENYPERKRIASEILKKHKFSPFPGESFGRRRVDKVMLCLSSNDPWRQQCYIKEDSFILDILTYDFGRVSVRTSS
jgi:hypothetical protein